MEDADPVSLACSIKRLSEHLDTLAMQVSAVEESLCDTFTCDKSRNINVKKIQGLDYIRQSLEDCAVLSLVLSKNIETEEFPAEEIICKLKLESTRAIIVPVLDKSGSYKGEVQLFE